VFSVAVFMTAWIEIGNKPSGPKYQAVAVFMTAWIEISKSAANRNACAKLQSS